MVQIAVAEVNALFRLLRLQYSGLVAKLVLQPHKRSGTIDLRITARRSCTFRQHARSTCSKTHTGCAGPRLFAAPNQHAAVKLNRCMQRTAAALFLKMHSQERTENCFFSASYFMIFFPGPSRICPRLLRRTPDETQPAKHDTCQSSDCSSLLHAHLHWPSRRPHGQEQEPSTAKPPGQQAQRQQARHLKVTSKRRDHWRGVGGEHHFAVVLVLQQAICVGGAGRLHLLRRDNRVRRPCRCRCASQRKLFKPLLHLRKHIRAGVIQR